jgi:hypothetical protein
MPVSNQSMTIGAANLRALRDDNCNATPENNITGGLPSTIFAVQIDNSANSATSYFKVYNNAAPVVGTTAPGMIIPVPGGKIVTAIFGPNGVNFLTALSFACVTSGGTGGAANPANTVTVALSATW